LIIDCNENALIQWLDSQLRKAGFKSCVQCQTLGKFVHFTLLQLYE